MALMAKVAIGFCAASASTNDMAPPDHTRLQGSSFVTGGAFHVQGNEATIDFWGSLSIPFGVGTGAVDHLIAGYQYIWNVNNRKFTIKNQVGNIISVRKILSISDLAIDMKIASSKQLTIIVDSDTLDSGYYIGQKMSGSRNGEDYRRAIEMPRGSTSLNFALPPQTAARIVSTPVPTPTTRQDTMRQNMKMPWLEAGELFIDGSIRPDARWKLSLMWEGGNKDWDVMMETLFTAQIRFATLLYALMQPLSSSADYTAKLGAGEKSFDAIRWRKVWQGDVAKATTQFMIYSIAISLLNASDPVFEPWILWETWRWLLKTSTIDIDDRIFDLSPQWG